MAEPEARARVVRIAREWIGTPYRHDSRIKRVAADCTFVAKVYEEAGVMPPIEIEPYSPQTHLHRAAGIYMAIVERHATRTETPKPGDLAMYFIGRDYSHGGIIVDWPDIIHGDSAAGFVLEAPGDQGQLADERVVKDRVFMTPWR